MPAREKSQNVAGYGDRLLNRLRILKWTQSELADRAHISRPTLHRAIHEDQVTGRIATKIARILGKEFLMPSALDRNASTSSDHVRSKQNPRSNATITWFGQALETVREDLEISQEELAKQAEISVNTYRRLITGSNTPKSVWLERISEALELSIPIPLSAVAKIVEPTDPLHTAIGRQLKAWRQSAGLYLYEASEMIDESAFFVACLEVGHDECMTFLDDLAALYGGTSDILFRAAELSLDPRKVSYSNPDGINSVLTFESAAKEANYRQQLREKNSPEDRSWDFELADKLAQRRRSVGLDRAEAAKRIGTKVSVLKGWEEANVEPTLDEFQRMANVYRSTPWQLRYGGRWERAWEFPSADESRAFIFTSILIPADLSWLHRFLAALAEFGLSEVELVQVRDTLLSPSYYGELTEYVPLEERATFVGARLRERAFEVWNDLLTPGWRDGAIEKRALPALCKSPQQQLDEDETILNAVRQRMNRKPPGFSARGSEEAKTET